jgi:hypothetical protein
MFALILVLLTLGRITARAGPKISPTNIPVATPLPAPPPTETPAPPTETQAPTETPAPPTKIPTPVKAPTPPQIPPDLLDPYDEFAGEPPSPIEYFIGLDMVRKIRVTTQDIWDAGGPEELMWTEEDAMVLARIAMGESPGSFNDRAYVMWNIRLRAELGFKGAGYYSGNRDLPDRWGPPTSIKQEALCYKGCQYSPAKAVVNIYFPLEANSHLRKILYPFDEDLIDFLVTYEMALQILDADFDSEFPEELKGYDGFRSPSVWWVGRIDWEGGLPSVQFFARQEVWRDEYEKDNIYWSQSMPVLHE